MTLHFAAPLCRETRKMRLVWLENERAGPDASDTAPPWTAESEEQAHKSATVRLD